MDTFIQFPIAVFEIEITINNNNTILEKTTVLETKRNLTSRLLLIYIKPFEKRSMRKIVLDILTTLFKTKYIFTTKKVGRPNVKKLAEEDLSF